MKTSNGSWAMVLVVVLCVGTMTLATDFVWDGAGVGHGGGAEGWTNITMWVQGAGYPDDDADNATIADVTTSPTCTFDAGSELTINTLEVTGDSPTWMKLHVKDAALSVDSWLILGDYGELDIDQDLTVHVGLACQAGTGPAAELRVQGSSKVDVASNKEFQVDELTANGSNAGLVLTTAGTFRTSKIVVDANAANAARTLKLVGGTLNLDSNCVFWDQKIIVESDPDGNGKAKLWVHSTTLEIGSDTATFVYFTGGDDVGEEVELDFDVDVDMDVGHTFVSCSGRVEIDLAANTTFSMHHLVIGDAVTGAVVKLTAGSGAKATITPLS